MSRNYFNNLPRRLQIEELSECRFIEPSEFNGIDALKGKKIVVVGCNSRGFLQGKKLQEIGLDVLFATDQGCTDEVGKRIEKHFTAGSYEDLIPQADLVINLSAEKEHSRVISQIMPLMKEGACLSFPNGITMVETGLEIRQDITVIMLTQKVPGDGLLENSEGDFGNPTLLAVHKENDLYNKGWTIAKAYCSGVSSEGVSVLQTSFVAETKSELMGGQSVLNGMMQAGSILCFDKMVEGGIDRSYASNLVRYGWKTLAEAMRLGGISNMMDRLSNPAKIKAYYLAMELKAFLTPLFQKQMDDIMSGTFSQAMMEDWKNGDVNLRKWRNQISSTALAVDESDVLDIREQEFFDKGVLMVAILKAAVELAYEVMISAGIKEESAYYASLHEAPLIANLFSAQKYQELQKVLSGTAEYCSYLFVNDAIPILKDFIGRVETDVIGNGLNDKDSGVDNLELISVNEAIRYTSIEAVGDKLRSYMRSHQLTAN